MSETNWEDVLEDYYYAKNRFHDMANREDWVQWLDENEQKAFDEYHALERKIIDKIESKMTLREFLEKYDNFNGYLVINDNNLKIYARAKVAAVAGSRNYERALECHVVSFGFYKDPGSDEYDLTVRLLEL